jgi:hypothetical protein
VRLGPQRLQDYNIKSLRDAQDGRAAWQSAPLPVRLAAGLVIQAPRALGAVWVGVAGVIPRADLRQGGAHGAHEEECRQAHHDVGAVRELV